MIKFVEEKYGRLDVFVGNAGGNSFVGKSLDTTEAAYDKMFNVNTKANFFFVAEIKHLLEKGNKPCIMFTTSVTGYHMPVMIGVYALTKATMNAMVTLFSKELKKQNIRVNGVAPGLIATDMTKMATENPNLDPRMLGTTDKVSGIVATVCSDEGSFINGEVIAMHGGFTKM